MNSNTFSDAPGQPHSYKYGSLSHTDAATRAQAVEHNLECIEIGKAIGSKALTVWIGDGSNFPGQSNFTKAFERYLAAMAEIYKGLPDDWKLFSFGKRGGFHFNDSKYGDDDLDAGAIEPYRLFLVFNELVDAEARGVEGRTAPAATGRRLRRSGRRWRAVRAASSDARAVIRCPSARSWHCRGRCRW